MSDNTLSREQANKHMRTMWQMWQKMYARGTPTTHAPTMNATATIVGRAWPCKMASAVKKSEINRNASASCEPADTRKRTHT